MKCNRCTRENDRPDMYYCSHCKAIRSLQYKGIRIGSKQKRHNYPKLSTTSKTNRVYE